MADFLQGDPLPSVTETSQKQNTLPQYLTDFQQDAINLGKNAVQQGGVAGLSPLQQQAINMAPKAGFAGSGSVGTAQDLLTQSGYTGANQIVQNYMNPYTQNVVEEMARLANKNYRQNMGGFEAATVGSGNFGSSRAAQQGGQTLADMQAALTGQQYGALSSGYKDAMTAAQNDLTRGVQAGQSLNQTAQVQNQIGTSGLKIMNELGGVQQKNEQDMLNYPMEQAKQFASLTAGMQAPTGSAEITTKPGQAGQYGLSGLEEIATMYALYKALQSGKPEDMASVSSMLNKQPVQKAEGGSVFQDSASQIPEGAVYYDEDGNFYDAEGNQLG
jgi:hypothetical protein